MFGTILDLFMYSVWIEKKKKFKKFWLTSFFSLLGIASFFAFKIFYKQSKINSINDLPWRDLFSVIQSRVLNYFWQGVANQKFWLSNQSSLIIIAQVANAWLLKLIKYK